MFPSDGSVWLGENLRGSQGYWNSYMTYVPGTDRVGDGRLFHFDAGSNLIDSYDVDNAPEFAGLKGVTHMALHPSERFIAYTTETG